MEKGTDTRSKAERLADARELLVALAVRLHDLRDAHLAPPALLERPAYNHRRDDAGDRPCYEERGHAALSAENRSSHAVYRS